jgi:hypothetical protein
MSQPELAAFKYTHADPAEVGGTRRKVFLVLLAMAISTSIFAFPFGLFLLIAPAIAWFSAPRLLHLGPRYLICGRRIVYYANVTRMRLDDAAGELHLHVAGGEPFVLRRAAFPTNARKSHKIEKNRAAKFDKVSSKIVAKVRAAAGVELSEKKR